MTSDPRRMVELFDAEIDPAIGSARVAFEPRYNVAPASLLLVFLAGREGRRMSAMHWGLDSPVGAIINARSETVSVKPTFASMTANRCLVPVDGYYEWEAVPGPRGGRGRRLPHYVTPVPGERLDHGGSFLVAGLWRPNGPRADGVLLTRAAAPEIAHVHDRMPLVLDEREARAWIDGEPVDAVVADALTHERVPVREHRVDVRVNDARNEGGGLIEPIPQETLF